MNKKYFVIFTFFFLFSCSSNKQGYKIINLVIEENNKDQECDSVDVVLLSVKFDKSFFNYYKKEKEKEITKNGWTIGGSFNWFEKNKRWVLNEDDIIYFKKNINKQKQVIFELNKLRNNTLSVSLVDFPIFNFYNNNIQKNKEIEKRIINSHYIYMYSMPVFNKNRTKALLCHIDALLGIVINYIYVKENGKWILSGKTSYSSE